MLIIELPDNFYVGGNLSLIGSLITELPKNIKIVKNLYIQDTNIKELPHNLSVETIILKNHTQYLNMKIPEHLKYKIYYDFN